MENKEHEDVKEEVETTETEESTEEPTEPPKSSNLPIIIGGLVGITVIGGIGYYLIKNKQTK
jgi:hypothetical protein